MIESAGGGSADSPRARRFTFHNHRSTVLHFWLEPWAEEFSIGPGSLLELVVEGDTGEMPNEPFELWDTHLTFYAAAETLVHVLIDGQQIPSGSSELRFPGSGGADTRKIVDLLFGGFSELRPGGMGIESTLERLGAPMADGDVQLEPLAEAHRAALEAACAEDLAIWQIYAWSWDPEHFDETFDRVMALENWRRFVIFSGERLVGISCFIGIDEARGVLEIGNTYYVPDMRGTGLNRAVKDLMIGRAVACGFRRIEFRVDRRNARSQAAMAKLGAVREGVIRAERITWTGHVRDTVLFSILAGEWKGADGAG